MENKAVGFLLIGISIVVGIMFYSFNNLTKRTLENSCSHGPTCSMYDGLRFNTYFAFSLIALIFMVGLIMLFLKPKEKIIIKQKTKFVKEKKRVIDMKDLEEKEKRIIRILQEENGAIFQASLMEKLGIGKVGLTRLLDKLEAKGIIERKRRGMNNIVVLR
ncbi:MAG: MarR family transcriptional regulator [Candidatus Pacearchaeota archaeon]